MTGQPNSVPRDWPLHDGAFMRVRHDDLPNASADDLWAESVMLTFALARRLRRDIRDRLLVIDYPDLAPIRESQWLRERLLRIDRELKARRT
jgi:hypothetical protein